ncbi:hypothetical protein JOF29_000387 [Kribbella aluminosa]|uniref:Uncharacterized protein n=1 Tax=Kribbella aluminosa TaxID=416017 RepID=A0ABS4UCD3_9ACTN|nr:hypothetical protein [Kribbella aluminosa]MBP2349304.1 hypothetical protein [Kribbella aluminosa]
MNRSYFTACAAALGMAATALAPAPASAATTSPASSTACVVTPGAVSAAGDVQRTMVVAGTPPTVQDIGGPDAGIFPPGQVRIAGSTVITPDVPAPYTGYVSGYQVLDGSMYNTGYYFGADGNVDRSTLHRSLVGGGWGAFTFFDVTRFYPATQYGGEYRHQYALRSDGTLFRWQNNGRPDWANKQSAPGFAAVKSMALISQTRTYETFLANTRSGALYTIRLPLSSPLKPVVRLVRSSTWQKFDTLLARKCGQYGVVLLAIDKDTGQGFLYAVGHANGTSTVIQGLGQVKSTFKDPVYYRSSIIPGSEPQPFGE